MPDQTTPEPSMEDILASIRRIISDDDAQPASEASVEDSEEPLELTERVDPADPAPEPSIAAEATDPLAAPETVAASPSPPPPAPAGSGGLVSPSAATAAASAFGQLSVAATPPADSRTLEDLTRELLRPMLQQWLDQNLPAIVQRAVDTEVERIARLR